MQPLPSSSTSPCATCGVGTGARGGAVHRVAVNGLDEAVSLVEPSPILQRHNLRARHRPAKVVVCGTVHRVAVNGLDEAVSLVEPPPILQVVGNFRIALRNPVHYIYEVELT